MTWRFYENIISNYFPKRLLKKQIQRIEPLDISRVINSLSKAGKVSTALQIHVTLKVIFNSAVKKGAVIRNPVLSVAKPKPNKKEMKTITPDQWRKIRDYMEAKKPRFLVAMTVLITIGLRRAELSGLQWQDIDFERMLLRVRRSFHTIDRQPVYSPPKTECSRRSVALDLHTLEMLERHRAETELLWFMWDETVQPESPVVSIDRKMPIKPDTLTQTWIRIRDGAGLPNVRLHDLRHSAAYLMLDAGIYPSRGR